jgi:hypothetical protein
MASVYKPIDGYRLWYYGKNSHHILIQTYHENAYVGSLTFRNSQSIPDNELDAAGYIRLSFHKDDYANLVDMLRNEKPLFMWINPANLIGGIATDSTEPVGEGEE